MIVRLIFFFLFLAYACTRPADSDATMKMQERIPSYDSLLYTGIDQTSRLRSDSARATLSELLRKAKKTNNPRYELLAYNNLGRLYQLNNLEDMATNAYLAALDIAKENDLTPYLNTLYNNLGIVYQNNKAYDRSLEYLSLALQQSRQRNDTLRTGLNLINLGGTYEKLGRDSDAVAAYQEALRYFFELADSSNIAPGYYGLGNHYFDQQYYDSALSYYQRGLYYSPKDEYHWLKWLGEFNSGRALLHLNRPAEAAENFQSAMLGFEQSHDLKLLIESNRLMADVEKQKGKTDAALVYSQRANVLLDSLLEKKSTKWASELQMNYAFGRKVKELDDLQMNARRKQTILIAGIAAVIIFGLLLVYSFRNANKLLKQRNIILEKEQELNALKLEKRATEQRAMKYKLELKNRELAGKAIHLISRDETLLRLQQSISNGMKGKQPDYKKIISENLAIIKAEENMEEEWHSFISHFEAVHPDFFKRLKKINSRLTPNDLRICAYLTMDMSAKEIARIYNISPESVRKRKQRLREKLGLPNGVDLDMWLHEQRS